jgi:hypothetical protein
MFQQSSDYISRPITTHGQMRRLPYQGDRHGTVDHGDASDGVFLLLHLWVLPSRWAIFLRRPPSSISSFWMASQCECLSLSAYGGAPGTKGWRSFGCKERGPNRLGNWARPAGSARLGRPFAPVGPHVIMLFAPPFASFWRCHTRVQDGGSPCMKSGLLRFNPRGCSFITLRSLPPVEVISSSSWTRTRLRNFSFELVVNPSFMSIFSYINTTLPNACTKMNLLYD